MSLFLHSQAQDYENISVFEADSLIQLNKDNENFVILDVRTPSEYLRDHLENAFTRNFYDDDFQLQMDSLNKDFTYLIYCQSGNRSGQSFTIMQNLGFKEVYNMLGGIAMWKTNNLPVTTELPVDKNLYSNSESMITQQLNLNIDAIDASLMDQISVTLTSEENVDITQLNTVQFQIQSESSSDANLQLCLESMVPANVDVSAVDVVRAQRLALSLEANPCTQDLIAGDVNESGSISGADLVEMVNVIIGKSESFSNSSSHVFLINDNQANCIDFPVTNLSALELNIQAIKKGDLTCEN